MAKKLKAPSYQWYPRDYIASTRVTMMSLTEEAIYRKLLDFCWLEGSVSSDPNRVIRLIGKGSTVNEVAEAMSMFEPHPEDDSKLIHHRLEMQRKEQKEFSEKMTKAANKRWNKEKDEKEMPKQCLSNANAMQEDMPKQCSTTTTTTTPTPTPATTTTPNKNNTLVSDETKTTLLALWNNSPKASRNRSSKKKVADAWKRVKTKPDQNQLIDAMDAWCKCEDWTKDGGQFAPGLHIWIKDEKWEDLPERSHKANHKVFENNTQQGNLI